MTEAMVWAEVRHQGLLCSPEDADLAEGGGLEWQGQLGTSTQAQLDG